MRPIAKHPELAPGRHGVSLESMGDLAIVAAGLKYISADETTTPALASLAADKAAELDNVRGALDIVLARKDVEISAHFVFSLAVTDAIEVGLVEHAADVVADTAPDTTESEHLQDPLQHDAAIDMRDSYIAQLEQLKRGGTEGTPHAQPPQGE